MTLIARSSRARAHALCKLKKILSETDGAERLKRQAVIDERENLLGQESPAGRPADMLNEKD